MQRGVGDLLAKINTRLRARSDGKSTGEFRTHVNVILTSVGVLDAGRSSRQRCVRIINKLGYRQLITRTPRFDYIIHRGKFSNNAIFIEDVVRVY